MPLSFRIMLVAALALLGLPARLALAQGTEEFPLLDSQSQTREFSGAKITTTTALRAGGNFEPGHRAYLQIDIETAVDGGGADGMPRAVVINGFVSVALPPGLEPDGQPRLMYYDPAKDRYEFCYSGGYPRLERFSGLTDAVNATTSGDPQRILDGLAEITAVLDPTVTVSGPSDPRLTRADASYAVTGAAWLIPCNVLFRELVGLFHPDTGLGRTARLRVNLPLKATAALTNPRVVVYVGGLSSAVAQGMLLPDQIPPTAIPLAPLPEPEPEPAAEGEAPAADGEAAPADDAPAAAAQESSTPAQEEANSAPAEEGAPGEQAPTKPEPIPTLVYSHQWIRWQTEATLPVALAPEEPELLPADEAPPALDEVTHITPSEFGEPPAEENTDTAPPAETAQPERPNRVEEDTESVSPPAEEQSSEPSDENFSPTLQEDEGVRQVAPGTLPEVEQTYSVPLKPLTGSGAGAESTPAANGNAGAAPAAGDGELPSTIRPEDAGGMTAGTFVPPTDLGEMVLIPEGYFLMGTGSDSSAGDADEMPQTQVYLPAYYIDKYPVTNRQFHNFVISAGYKPQGHWMKYYFEGTADLPVRGVTWNDAMAFAKWAGKRLPTEAEWEKAARGEDGRTYPWGEEWTASLLPRGEMLADIMLAPGTESPYGVMGMVGLIWQWTASPYAPYPYDPEARGEKRVLRGGAFSNGRNIVRCANRYDEPPNVALNTFGLRCVKDAP